MLPLLATAIVAATGNIYYGLWYPIGDRGDDLHRRRNDAARHARHRHCGRLQHGSHTERVTVSFGAATLYGAPNDHPPEPVTW